MGFDEKKTLGKKETGAKAALPIWMNFMATALARGRSRRDFLPIPEMTNQELPAHPVLVRRARQISISPTLPYKNAAGNK